MLDTFILTCFFIYVHNRTLMTAMAAKQLKTNFNYMDKLIDEIDVNLSGESSQLITLFLSNRQ